MVAVVEAEFLEGGAEGWVGCVRECSIALCRCPGCNATGYTVLTSCASATQAQCEDSHGHHTAALSAVDVGVIGEDVGDWLRGVWLESHCGCVGSKLHLIFNGVTFAPRDQTVKMAVGAQIDFLHRRSAQESKSEGIDWARGVCYSERRQAWKYGIASVELNAGKRSRLDSGAEGGARYRSRDTP